MLSTCGLRFIQTGFEALYTTPRGICHGVPEAQRLVLVGTFVE